MVGLVSMSPTPPFSGQVITATDRASVSAVSGYRVGVAMWARVRLFVQEKRRSMGVTWASRFLV